MVQWVLQWERQKMSSRRKRQGPWQRNDVIIIFLGKEKMKTREYKRMVKLD